MGRPSLGHYVSFLFESIGCGWDGWLLTALRTSDLAQLRDDCDRLTKCRSEEFAKPSTLLAQRKREA
jgi:hypothetical protein